MTEKENHLPNLSSEERAHALELAIQARRRYAALKARVKSGELTFTDAMDEEDAKRILVTSLLQSVPGIGASKAVGLAGSDVLVLHGIDDSNIALTDEVLVRIQAVHGSGGKRGLRDGDGLGLVLDIGMLSLTSYTAGGRNCTA